MADDQWHLDKRIPIGIITSIIIQTLVFVYIGTAWKTDIEGRIMVLEKTDQGQSSHETRIVIVEQAVLRIKDDIAEIKDMLRATQRATREPTQLLGGPTPPAE